MRVWVAAFDDLDSASEAVSAIIGAGILPTALEMMDAVITRAVEAAFHAGYPTDAAAYLLVERAGFEEDVAAAEAAIHAIVMERGAHSWRCARDKTERDALWAGRKGAAGATGRIAPNYYTQDVCVPRSRLPQALRAVDAAASENGIVVGNVFHAGDGNLHPLLMYDRRDRRQVAAVVETGNAILQSAVDLGGTISGEHGIGWEKREAMTRVYSTADLATMARVRDVFDPSRMLNPEKIFPSGRVAPKSRRRERAARARRLSPKSSGAAIARARRSASSAATRCAGMGFPPERVDVTLSTGALKGVVANERADLVIAALAGTTIAELANLLAAQRQFVPFDAPQRRYATLGGTLAAGWLGPRRHLYGRPRDYVLGSTIVLADGTIARAGGMVVKNVAGYDMTRLYVGSFGTLGVLGADQSQNDAASGTGAYLSRAAARTERASARARSSHPCGFLPPPPFGSMDSGVRFPAMTATTGASSHCSRAARRCSSERRWRCVPRLGEPAFPRRA